MIGKLFGALVISSALIGLPCGLLPVSAQNRTPGGLQIAGRVLAIDANGDILRLEAQPLEQSSSVQVMDFLMTNDTLLTKEGRVVEPKELRFGEPVLIDYTIENGNKVARTISVQQSPEPRSAPNQGAAPHQGPHQSPTPTAP